MPRPLSCSRWRSFWTDGPLRRSRQASRRACLGMRSPYPEQPAPIRWRDLSRELQQQLLGQLAAALLQSVGAGGAVEAIRDGQDSRDPSAAAGGGVRAAVDDAPGDRAPGVEPTSARAATA